MKPIVELSPNRTAVIGNFSGHARTLPDTTTHDEIADRVFAGSTSGLPGYLAHYRPEVETEVHLPMIVDGKVVVAARRLRLPFGGAMRRGFMPEDEVAALIASSAAQALIVDVVDADDGAVHPALEAALLADGLAALLDPKGPFAKLDLGTADGVGAARLALQSDSSGGGFSAQARRELLPGADAILLPSVTTVEPVTAFPLNRAPGISAKLALGQLATLRQAGASIALDLIEYAGTNWRDVARGARAEILAALQAAVVKLTAEIKPLQQVWLSLAMTTRAAAQHCATPPSTLDLSVEDLLTRGDSRVPMADTNGLWFQQELFNAVTIPMTAIDLSTSVSMVLLAEPVPSLSALETLGRYAEGARTMVFASLDPASLTDLRNNLEREAFEKDNETWKRHVAVYAPSILVDGPAGSQDKIALPAAAAVVPRLIQVKTQRVQPGEEAGEYARSVVGASVPVLIKGQSIPGASPRFVINDTALHGRMAKEQVTLLYHSDLLGTFASDAATLYQSKDPASAIYGVSTATMLTNYLTRTIAHHMRLHYDGQPGTNETAKSLESEIRGLIKALDNGTKATSRKILVADQTRVEVRLVDNGQRLDVKLSVGVPNILRTIKAPDVEAHTATFDLVFDRDAESWTLSAEHHTLN